MKTRLLRGAAALSTLAFVFGVAGCFDEKEIITVHEDGSGMIRFESKTDPNAAMKGMGAPEKKVTQEDAEKLCYDKLASHDGIVAWTDVKCAATDKGIEWSATGWFEDITKVKTKESKGPGQQNSAKVPMWKKNADGTFTCTFPGKPKQPGGAEAKKKEPLDEDPMPDFIYDAIKDLHMVIGLELPGTITKADPIWKLEGKKATIAIHGDQLSKALKSYEEERAGMKKDVEAKKITAEDANKKLKARQAELIPMAKMEEEGKDLEITCKGGEDTGAKAFKDALADAKKSYAGSETEKKVKAAAEARDKRMSGKKGGE